MISQASNHLCYCPAYKRHLAREFITEKLDFGYAQIDFLKVAFEINKQNAPLTTSMSRALNYSSLPYNSEREI